MNGKQTNEADPRIQAAVAELQGLIRAKYPASQFAVSLGDDPEGIYLTATVDVADTDEGVDLFVDRLTELQADEGLPIYVVPIRPLPRVLADLEQQEPKHRGTKALRGTK